MGSKRLDVDKMIVEVLVSQEELRHLKGEIDNVHLISEEIANIPSRVSLRGRNEATKYFLIPKKLRKQLNISGKVSCQRIQKDNKSIFIYVLDPISNGRQSFIQEA